MNDGEIECKEECKEKGQIPQELKKQVQQVQHLKENVLELYERLNDIMNTSKADPTEDKKESKELVPIADCIRHNRYCIQEINEKVEDILDSIEL